MPTRRGPAGGGSEGEMPNASLGPPPPRAQRVTISLGNGRLFMGGKNTTKDINNLSEDTEEFNHRET